MAPTASRGSRGILLFLNLCSPVACLWVGRSGSVGMGYAGDRRPLPGGVYEAYRRNLATGANLPKAGPVLGLWEFYEKPKELRRSDGEGPSDVIRDAESPGEAGRDEEPIGTAGTKPRPYAAAYYARHGYDDGDDDGYGAGGYGYSDDEDDGYGDDAGYGYGDDAGGYGHGYGDDEGSYGYAYGDDAYGYGDSDEGYGYGYDNGYGDTGYGYGESYGYGGKGEGHGGGGGIRGGGGGRGGHAGGYPAGGGHNGGGHGSRGGGGGGRRYAENAPCKCRNLSIIGTLTGFSTVPALVALATQLSQSGARGARTLPADASGPKQRISVTSDMAIKAALKFLEGTRQARATRGLSVGHGNPHCQCTLSLLGSIAGFASLTTLLGIALSQAGSSEGGDASGDATRTAINISNTWNPINSTESSQSVAKLPALTEGSSLIEGFPFLPELGPLRSNLSYPDQHRTSPQSVLSGSSINRDATLISLVDNAAMKGQEKLNIPAFSPHDFNQNRLNEE